MHFSLEILAEVCITADAAIVGGEHVAVFWWPIRSQVGASLLIYCHFLMLCFSKFLRRLGTIYFKLGTEGGQNILGVGSRVVEIGVWSIR